MKAALPRTIQKTINLHRAQHDFRHATALYRGFVGGVGCGKSWIGAYDLIRRAERGKLYMVISPSYKMLSDSTMRSFVDAAKSLQVYDAKNFKLNPAPSCKLSTGAEVLFRSADDPESLRGPNLSGIWIDEASLCHEDTFKIGIGRLREAGQLGWLSATFTPKGKQHWTYQTFGKGKPNTSLVVAKTKDNPFLHPEFAKNLEEQYGAGSRLALQELEGLFVDWSGGIFEAGWFVLVDDAPRMASRVRYWDKAGTEGGGANTAGVLISRDTRGWYFVEDVVRGQFSAMNREATIKQTAMLDRQRYGHVTIVIEQEPGSGGKESAEATVRNLAGFTVRVDRVTDPKNERYLPLASQAEAKNVYVLNRPWTPAFLEELAAVPEGKFKDQADAAAGAFSHVSKMVIGSTTGISLPTDSQRTILGLSDDVFR